MRIFYQLIIFLLLASSVLNGQDTCTLPTITSSSGEGVYCRGDKVVLSVEGNLGDGTQWEWSAGTCGENIFQTGSATTVTISVTTSISYFVRGVGGCVPAGGTCQEFKITLDDEPPTPTCSEDITVIVASGETEAVVDYGIPSATDNCPGGIKIELVEGIKSGGSFPLGTTTVTYRFTDARQNTTTCSFDVNIKEGNSPTDPTGPMITCPEDITVKAEPEKCGATVEYKVPVASGDAKVELTAGLGSGSFFPVGTTTETYTATDASGNSMSCSFKVTVTANEDSNQPPTIVLSKSSVKLWPPNHRQVTLQAGDFVESIDGNCELTDQHVVITKVTSNEPLNGKGDGNTDDDIIISDDCNSVDLRVERQGFGNGRVYTIYLAVMDDDGNEDQAKVTAIVPHNQGNHNGNNGNKKDDDDDDDSNKPEYTVEGCDPSPPPPPEAPPVMYYYEDSEPEYQLTTSINPYPNPFNGTLGVRFTATKNDNVSLDLYDLRGLKVKGLFQGELKAHQTYNWSFDVQEVDKKIYLLVIKGRNTLVTKKVIKN